MWEELDEKQNRWGNLPSVYNAALNNKSGCINAANAIIKYKMPQVPYINPWAGATEHVEVFGSFTLNLVRWLEVFARHLVQYWEKPEYKKARQTSGPDAERTIFSRLEYEQASSSKRGQQADDAIEDEHL